ncbi:MAG: hypothetical protein MJA29_03385, partial [Candidatus Omnitrophica bacterium]|nr:hypothetical protein [Candidatus Omnitrophota bacterium]
MKLLLRRALLFACICSLLAVLAPAAYRALRVPAVTAGEQAGSVEPSAVRRESPRVGEVLTYDVKMGVIKLGTSVFRQLPGEEVNGTWLQVMSFETDLSRFKDTEMIYSDPVTFLPVIVERDIVNFFFKENITETYDQQKYTLTINKHAGA